MPTNNPLVRYLNNKNLGTEIDTINEYTINDLPEPSDLPAGSVLMCDGTEIKTNGVRYKRTACPGKPHLIGARNFFPDTNAVVSSLTRAYLIYKPISTDNVLNGLEFVFANWYTAQNGIETNNNSTVTIKVGIQFEGSSDVIPVFFQGVRTATLAPGVTLKTDRVPVYIDPTITAGFYLRIWVSVPSATDTLCTSAHLTGIEQTMQKTYRIDGATNDFVDNTAYSTSGKSANPYEFGPVATLGYTVDSSQIPSVAILGSSSATGVGDSLSTTNNQYVMGYIARSLKEKSIPYINVACSGETALNFLTDGGAKRRLVLSMCNCTYAVSTYGSNDIGSGANYDTMIARIRRLNQLMIGLGCTAYFCTFTPATSSTDSWATVGNQTVGNVIRVQINTWLRDTSGYKVIDLEQWSDSGRSIGGPATGKWRVDLGQPTTDGLHGTPIIHQAIQNGINQIANAWRNIKF